jgi:hypothetical protein
MNWPSSLSACPPLQFGVTDRLADNLLDCTFDLLRRRAAHLRVTPTIVPNCSASESGWVSPLKKMTECSQRLKTVAYDLREDRARNTPHPEPEGERDDDGDAIEGEPSGQEHRRYTLALNQMKSKIKTRRKQRLPERVMAQQASEKKIKTPIAVPRIGT